MPTTKNVIDLLTKLAFDNPDIEVMWLYGSRVNGTATQASDYDLAIAFSLKKSKYNQSLYYSEELAYEWSNKTLSEISVIDINKIPVPLAYSVINEGEVVFSRNDLRLHGEESRVWSLWEAYCYDYARK